MLGFIQAGGHQIRGARRPGELSTQHAICCELGLALGGGGGGGRAGGWKQLDCGGLFIPSELGNLTFDEERAQATPALAMGGLRNGRQYVLERQQGK